ncbi:hypothetical protein NA56DRAFT_183937 [Hyaloscypha hepaticicola]|uniref:Uncharacterized protein n=1 Tax=Hyaloscypha hepaticicola TaxID=2082293 RepID=A0A2J6Q1H7_9HELO|nr:hypothetical protein NA56DRAFT_183937 [Hyaloscypha hepaticicola]
MPHAADFGLRLGWQGQANVHYPSYLTVQCRFSRLNTSHSSASIAATDPTMQGSNDVRRYIGLTFRTHNLYVAFSLPFAINYSVNPIPNSPSIPSLTYPLYQKPLLLTYSLRTVRVPETCYEHCAVLCLATKLVIRYKYGPTHLYFSCTRMVTVRSDGENN